MLCEISEIQSIFSSIGSKFILVAWDTIPSRQWLQLTKKTFAVQSYRKFKLQCIIFRKVNFFNEWEQHVFFHRNEGLLFLTENFIASPESLSSVENNRKFTGNRLDISFKKISSTNYDFVIFSTDDWFSVTRTIINALLPSLSNCLFR